MSHRLPVAPGTLAAGARALGDADRHSLLRVRRARAGDPVELFDGAGWRASAVIAELTADRLVLQVDAPSESSVESPLALTVLLSLIKGDRMELAIQKLVELGVSGIQPVIAARSVVRLDERRAASRHQRYQAVATDAARQCGRARVPEVAPIRPLLEAVRDTEAALKLVFWARSHQGGLTAHGPAPTVAALIGPEGGLEVGEVEAALAAGFVETRLGPRILRAETAAIAAAAAIQLAFGDLG
jgi:16S rRNA (uracil1498-N3)-methyltransferase